MGSTKQFHTAESSDQVGLDDTEARKRSNDIQQIKPVALTDVLSNANKNRHDEAVSYNDDELIIIDDLRDIPDFSGYKIAFNVVGVCVTGKMQLDVTGEQVVVTKGQIIVCHSYSVLSNYMISPDFECKVMCVSDRLLRSILGSQMQQWNKMLYQQRCTIINADVEAMAIYHHLRYQWLRKESVYKREILISLLRAALLEVCELLLLEEEKREETVLPENGSRMETLFHHFLENIARRHIKRLSVAEYAEELCISPKYLSTVCRTVSGKSPIVWISEYVDEDITYYLRQTDLSAKEISDELGFPNTSFFGKYVREHLGMSPIEYRKKLQTPINKSV